MLRLVESAGFAGLVVEVYGAGHASQHTIGPIKSLASSMPVVFASRTGAGELHQSYAEFPGSERDMLRAGLIPAVCLDGLKSRLLLSLLLASGADRSRIGLWFAEMAE
jgi:L-asparaginase